MKCSSWVSKRDHIILLNGKSHELAELEPLNNASFPEALDRQCMLSNFFLVRKASYFKIVRIVSFSWDLMVVSQSTDGPY